MSVDWSSDRALWRRPLLITVAILVAYRLGCQLLLPELDRSVLQGSYSGASVERFSIFALGVTPLFAMLLLVVLAHLILPKFVPAPEGNNRAGEIVVYLGGLALALFQARAIAGGLERIPGLVAEPDLTFRIEIVATLVAGTALLAAAGAAITRYGIGNGFWLLLITPVLFIFLNSVVVIRDLLDRGYLPQETVASIILFMCLATALVVAVVGARRGSSLEDADPMRWLRIDGAMIFPPLLAQYVALPGIVAVLNALHHAHIGFNKVVFPAGSPRLYFAYAILILLFNFLWRRADAFKSGAKDPRPVWLLAITQIVVCVGAMLLTRYFWNLSFDISGIWLIVIATVIADTLAPFRAKAEPSPSPIDVGGEEPA